MRLQLAFTALLATLATAATTPSSDFGYNPLLEKYITSEGKAAHQGLLNNIGTASAHPDGALNGVVVAAPSTDPDYRYTWIRDSSLVFKCLIDRFTSGRDAVVKNLVLAWIPSQGRLQKIDNPSGTLTTGGLGEPKFNLNETAFTGSWGRPQRDGPALRTTAIVAFAKSQPPSYLKNTAWPVLKLDLDYLTNFWNQTGFDLWEELDGSSFFTLSATHRALREGVVAAKAVGDTARAKSYGMQAKNVLCFLQSFWTPGKNYIISNINLGSTRTGLDANSILSSIHNFDPQAGCDSYTFQPCSDKALANHKAVVDSFRAIYTINKGIPASGAAAIGRYAEDVYFDGNPWFLSNFAAAEQLYDALWQWHHQAYLKITPVSLPFFKQIYPAAHVGTFHSDSDSYSAITRAVGKYADGFVAINAKYTPASGELSEQFSRENGTEISAPNLTWSYASALTAFDARAGRVPPGWGAKGLVPPRICETKPVPLIEVIFHVTSDSPNLFIVGSINQLKSWNPAEGIPLTSTGTAGQWTVTLQLPASITFEYKYIRKDAAGAVTWESDPNNRAGTPAKGRFTITDVWR